MSETPEQDGPALLERFDVTTTGIDIGDERFAIVHPRDADALIDEAAFRHDERLPYWADIWPAAIAMSRAVRAMNGTGKTLLELGCGVGLVTAAALRAGFDVTASDYYREAIEFARINGLANAGREPQTLLLDWRAMPSAIAAFDIVAASDVLYEGQYGPVVARAIATTLAENGRALISDPGRVGSPTFFEALKDVGLKHVGANVVTVTLHGRDQAITVHEISH